MSSSIASSGMDRPKYCLIHRFSSRVGDSRSTQIGWNLESSSNESISSWKSLPLASVKMLSMADRIGVRFQLFGQEVAGDKQLSNNWDRHQSDRKLPTRVGFQGALSSGCDRAIMPPCRAARPAIRDSRGLLGTGAPG